MQKDAVKEEKLEKERRKVLKEKKRAKEGQRERETEVLGEKEKDKEVLHKSDSGFHIKRFQSNLNCSETKLNRNVFLFFNFEEHLLHIYYFSARKKL